MSPSTSSSHRLPGVLNTTTHQRHADDNVDPFTVPPHSPSISARREPDPSHSDDLDPAGLPAVHGQSDSHGQGHLSPSVNDGVAAADEARYERDAGENVTLSSASPLPSTDSLVTPCCQCHVRHASRNKKGYLSCGDQGYHLAECECKGTCPEGQCGLQQCLSNLCGPIAGLQYTCETKKASRMKAAAKTTTHDGKEESEEGEVQLLGVRRSKRTASSCVPYDISDLLRALTAKVMTVIADGRCSVASVLLALSIIPQDHNNLVGKRIIDDARRALGHSMQTLWSSEREWINEVPVELRIPNARLGKDPANKADNILVQSSFSALQALLTQDSPTKWLDHTAFYLASRMYNVGIIIVVPARGGAPLYCRRIGAHYRRYIVLLHRGVHYECVQWEERTVFPSAHSLVKRLVLLSIPTLL